MRSTPNSAKSVFGSLKYECPHCHKRVKTITVELFGKPTEVPCWTSCGCEESKLDGMLIEQADRKFALAGIPERYLKAECDLQNRQFAVNEGKSLYIYGDYGVGKTHYACALAKALMNMGNSVRFENSKKFISEIQGMYSGRNSDVLERAYACRVLVLDDLGKEQPTPFALSMLYELVDSRYSACKPMVVTSNFRKDLLMERWANADEATAEAIVSRLCEAETVEMDGRDWRVA